jgi:hypothetical protein
MRSMILTFIAAAGICTASTLHVGTGQTYADPARASRDARPGDTILIHNGTYQGTFWIENMQGTSEAWIVVRGEDRDGVRLEGGTESMHLSDCAYVRIENMTVTRQTGNGMNIDDAGTMETPTHHIVIRNVTFTDMNAAGNNDMLKLSGLEDFVIEDCSFTDGSAIAASCAHASSSVRARMRSRQRAEHSSCASSATVSWMPGSAP